MSFHRARHDQRLQLRGFSQDSGKSITPPVGRLWSKPDHELRDSVVQRRGTNRRQRLDEVVIPDVDHGQRGEVQGIEDAERDGSFDIECSDGKKEDRVSRALADSGIVKDLDQG